MFGRKNPIAPDEIDGRCKNIKGCPEGRAVSLLAHDFPLESRVCYTFVEQIATGIVAHPGKCGYSCGILSLKLPLAGQPKRQKKAGRRCGYALSASRVICGTKLLLISRTKK